MASFDVFRSVGPTVDVRLFNDAISQGVRTGNELPTPLTSAIKGTQEGIKTGLQLQALAQENEIRSNQIEQLPVQNKMNEARAAIADLNAQVLLQNQDLYAQDEVAKLTNERDTNQAAIQIRARTNDFNSKFASSSPQEQARLVLSGQYNDVFAANKDLMLSTLNSIYSNTNNGLDQNQRDTVGRLLKVRTTQDAYDKLALQNLPKFQAAQTELESSPLTNALTAAGKLDVPIYQYPDAVQFQPAGKFSVNPKTGQVYKNPDGTWTESPDFALNATNKDKYDVFSKSGELLYPGSEDHSNITGLGKKAFDNYTTQLSIQSGNQARKAIGQIIKPQQGTTQAAPKALNIPTLSGDTTPQIESADKLVNQDPFISAIKEKLNLSDSVIDSVKAPIENLNRQITAYTNSPSYRGSAAGQLALNEAVSQTARSISDSQFNVNPQVKAQYTEADVAKYNAALAQRTLPLNNIQYSLSGVKPPEYYGVLEDKISKLGDADTIDRSVFGTGSSANTLYDAFKVNSPEELYFVTQRAKLETSLNSIVTGAMTKQEAKAQQPVRAVNSRNKNIAFLSKAASGRQ